MIIRFGVFLIIIFLGFTSCTKSPSLQFSNKKITDHIYSSDKLVGKIRGFGDISVAVDGKRYNGSIDVDWEQANFKASAYSPFGTLVASFSADSVDGIIFVDGKVRKFPLESEPDLSPFVLGEGICFKDFISIITGRIPTEYFTLQSEPDTVIYSKRNVILSWSSDRFETMALISKKDSKLVKFIVKSTVGNGWELAFSNPAFELARTIELKINDRNYFSINYERLKRQ